MWITINGQRQETDGPLSVADLLDTRSLDRRCVAVELNKAIVRRDDYDATTLAEDDVLEIVTLVGGGQRPYVDAETPITVTDY